MRKLIFTTGSPFARAVRIVLDEKGLEWERQEEITTPSVEARAQTSPTCKSDPDRRRLRLWDSAVILDYLTTSYPCRDIPGTPHATRRIRPCGPRLGRQTGVCHAADAGRQHDVISQLQWAGVKHEDNAYAERCAARIQHVLDWCESMLASSDEGFVPGLLSAQDVLLGVMIMFMEKRPLRLSWRSRERRKMAALHARLQSRPSFIEKPILWWEPGVVGTTATRRSLPTPTRDRLGDRSANDSATAHMATACEGCHINPSPGRGEIANGSGTVRRG
jgi:glutathione S-transferase